MKGKTIYEFEDRCKCGSAIPRGYGYYMHQKPLRCKMCGRVNINKEDGRNGSK